MTATYSDAEQAAAERVHVDINRSRVLELRARARRYERDVRYAATADLIEKCRAAAADFRTVAKAVAREQRKATREALR